MPGVTSADFVTANSYTFCMSIEMTTEFKQALELLNGGKNLFLTGKAGTGKSTLINEFRNTTTRNIVVTAPTGVAALNVHGYTIHRLFSFPSHVTVEGIRSADIRPGRFASVLKELDTLIIDEVSMVRADLFDCIVATLEMYGPRPHTPYGGVQLVLVGDLYQLPPVVKEDEEACLRASYETPFFFSATSYRNTDFPVVQLTKVFRQVGDQQLVDLLNAIREGKMSAEVRNRLNSRIKPEFTPPSDEYWLTLASTNRSVNKINREALARISGEVFTYRACETGDQDKFDYPTEQELKFKVGAQVMLLTNHPQRKWVNGSVGVITRVSYDDDGRMVVHVKLDSGEVVEVTEHTWQITRPAPAGGKLGYEVVGTFTQLPFKLAWAITIHKSQGQTLDRAVINLVGGMRAAGQLYVALSRCTSFDGLVLTREIAPRDVKVDHRVHRFLMEATGEKTEKKSFIECIYVGQGDGYIRPIEIAVAVENEAPLTTLINPTRDLGFSAQKYGLSSSDLQIAPTLDEAWPFIETEILGSGVVSSLGDELVNILDTELKRAGLVTGLQMVARPRRIIEVAGRASDIVRATQYIVAQEGLTNQLFPYNPLDELPTGYRLTPDFEIIPYGSPEDVAQLLEKKLSDKCLTQRSEEVLQRFEKAFGVTVRRPEKAELPPLAQLLSLGARVCFTGSVFNNGREWRREDMEKLAKEHGLVVAPQVSKTRCDVLIAADVATQSGKARKAAQFGKPIYSAEHFLKWAKQ